MTYNSTYLKTLRKHFHKTQRQMSEVLCCTLRCYQMYERGDLLFPDYRASLLDFLVIKWKKELE